MQKNRARAVHSESKQQVRVRRFLLAASAYGVCLPLLGIAEFLKILSPGAAVATAIVIVAVNLALYVVFHINLNERFSDPSLTWPQILAATIVLMFVVYHVNGDRGMALMMTLVVLSFGTFRFSTREFLTASGVILAAYAAVINLLMWFAPERIDVPVEGFRWTMLALVLPCYAAVAGRLSEMRQRVRRTNEELSQALEMIQKLATHDTLTGLPNRALFNEALGHAIARSARHQRGAAVFFLDLDRFKNINDTLGHTVGDRVLQEAARRLTGAVRASDVVARLGGDEFVLLAPDKFVPLAEEIGEIVPIGYWTLKHVCELIRRWSDTGTPLSVAVNLSASQFHEPDLAEKLGAILKTTGIARGMLELEITESMVMRDPDRAAGVMEALRAMGVCITIDDFGTGHSSLGYLKRFPITRLKVDRSFVRDLPHNGDDI